VNCPTDFPFLFGFIVFTLKFLDRACGCVTQNVNCWHLFKYRRNLEVGGGQIPPQYFLPNVEIFCLLSYDMV
jgi:hypothetical protein